MCGIVAITGYKNALPLLIHGLEKLEYRGYDSAGIAIISPDTKDIICNKAQGKLRNFTFLITGKLQNMSRAEAKSIIEKNSGKILSSVSKKLNYLIVGEKPTLKKVNQAKEIKIKIINQIEFNKLIN